MKNIYIKKGIFWNIIILLFFCYFNAYADEIKLLDGSHYKGIIKNASRINISFVTNDSLRLKIPRDSISYVVFSSSDQVMLHSMEIIQCKILEETATDLLVLTKKGLQRIPLKEVSIKLYNSSGRLKVTELPETGSDFRGSGYQQPMPYKKGTFIGICITSLNAQSKNWQKQFFYDKSGYKVFGGGVVGHNFGKAWIPVMGYETSIGNQENDTNYQSHFKLNFIFLGLECAFPLTYHSKVQFMPAIHTGVFQIRGNAYTYSYREYALNENKFAIKPQIGLFAFLTKHTSAYIGIGYLFVPILNLEGPSIGNRGLSLNFGGMTFFARISYHLETR